MLKLLFSIATGFIYLCFYAQACFPPKIESTFIEIGETSVEFCSVSKASKRITRDEFENFFEQINVLDISIQMKKELLFASNMIAVDAYKSFLADQVLEFKQEEITFIEDILKKCIKEIHSVNSNILPDTIHLIKIDGSGYGNGVFYTRENAIIIPKNELGSLNSQPQYKHLEAVLYHELFHIISRNNESLKSLLYKEIGFEQLQAKLVIPEVIRQRKLLNPDGIDNSYFIRLAQGEAHPEKLAIPLIISNESLFKNEKPLFFSYIDFDLYEIVQTGESSYTLVCNSDGSSSLEHAYKPSFFMQIRDNTDYIIHPDEIIADNFTYCMMKEDQNLKNEFSEQGKLLISSVREILSRKL